MLTASEIKQIKFCWVVLAGFVMFCMIAKSASSVAPAAAPAAAQAFGANLEYARNEESRRIVNAWPASLSGSRVSGSTIVLFTKRVDALEAYAMSVPQNVTPQEGVELICDESFGDNPKRLNQSLFEEVWFYDADMNHFSIHLPVYCPVKRPVAATPVAATPIATPTTERDAACDNGMCTPK